MNLTAHPALSLGSVLAAACSLSLAAPCAAQSKPPCFQKGDFGGGQSGEVALRGNAVSGAERLALRMTYAVPFKQGAFPTDVRGYRAIEGVNAGMMITLEGEIERGSYNVS
jgi:hypothetical protein